MADVKFISPNFLFEHPVEFLNVPETLREAVHKLMCKMYPAWEETVKKAMKEFTRCKDGKLFAWKCIDGSSYVKPYKVKLPFEV